jgi:hypothetical protein
MAKIQKVPTGEFSSYYGCYIIVMAAFVFFGIIAWSAWSFFKQNEEIGKFTVDEPVKFEVKALPEVEMKTLREKLAAFGEAAKAGTPAVLSLTLDEMNAVIQIAPDSGYGSYKDIVHLKKTDPANNRLIADLSMPLRGLESWKVKTRYMIAEGVFLMQVHEEGIDAKLIDVMIPGKTVPPGFVDNLQIWTWIAPYRKLEPLGSMLKGVKKVTVTAEGITMSTTKE